MAWISHDERKVVFSFDSSQFNTACENSPTQNWKVVFSDIPYRTRGEVREQVDKEWRRRGIFYRLIKTHWFFKASVVPIGYIIFEFLGPEWVSILALIYAIWRSITDGYRVWRPKPKTNKQVEKDEIERKKEHYFYHCELNPEGFNKLRNENFGRSIKEDNQARIAKIKEKHISTKRD
ncbi:hypothetical protein [Thalassospira sp. GB04J01]|uniref:hypothetical protein n=1 Tax=Thalassospira sp. GB04J01 TaxID=1485225 RepID=UPI000C9AA7A9|nr:hypothetical protein [Thalassospira sp. GB04J01]